jgi:hypothetical protein
MGHPFEMWADRIAAADEESRRAMITEARVYRARNLSDVSAQRRATYTLSQLHHLQGERDQAAHEAKQLLSLCQTLPAASREETEATRTWLRALGEHAPKVVAPPRERSWREEDGPRRRDRPARTDARPARADGARPARADGARRADDRPTPADPGRVRAFAAEGRFADALAAVGDGRGASTELLRAALRLEQALASSDPMPALRALRADLSRRVGLGGRAEGAASDPLSALLGAPAPSRRAERIDAIEAFADANPSRVDELAAAALRHHLATAGPAPAPWLAGTVARALSSGAADHTEAALAELRAAGSHAVSCYDEWPFTRLLRVLGRARADGVPVTAVRRGVLARHEPDERKLWTMRVRPASGERMLAVAPHAAQPYEGDLARDLAERLHALSPSTLLVATGSGNEALRTYARERGLAVRDRDGDDAELLGELLALPAAPSAPAPRAPAPRAPAPAPEGDASAAAAPVDRLADLVTQTPLDRPRIQAAIASMRRADRALRIVQKLALSDEALATVLELVAATIGNDRPIPEGTTLALRGAVAGPRTREQLRDPRYGGPGVDALVDVARVLTEAGWDVHRVLRGPTRREIERNPALDSLSGGLAGLWRLLVRHGDRKGEVWYVADLPVEGRAALPLLLLEEFQRAILVAGDAVDPWQSLGVSPIAWGADAAPALLASVDRFVARAEPADADESGASA